MSKEASATYQEYKEKIQKKSHKDIKIFLKKEKTKIENMLVNVIKISQKMKNKSQLSIEKNIVQCKKITKRLLDEVLVTSYKSESGVILE